MDFQSIIDKYYPEDKQLLRDILIKHSTLVMKRAVSICDANPSLCINRDFVIEAAMLHDIGIFECDAPGIECYGDKPYLCHGYIGAQLLRKEGYPDHARVCERHTGAGLTKDEICANNLPLPHKDFLPETIEEQVICYADKFYSKSHPEREKTFEAAKASLAKFGEPGLERFIHWKSIFE